MIAYKVADYLLADDAEVRKSLEVLLSREDSETVSAVSGLAVRLGAASASRQAVWPVRGRLSEASARPLLARKGLVRPETKRPTARPGQGRRLGLALCPKIGRSPEASV